MKNLSAIVIVGIAIFSGATARAQETTTGRYTIPWSDPTKPGLVKVELFGGSITVKTHTGRDVIIQSKSGPIPINSRNRPQPPEAAGLQRIGGNLGSGIVADEAKNVLTIESSPFQRPVDIEIQVPPKTNLNLSTMNGSIGAEGVEGEIEITNMNGPVTVTNVSGIVMAHSMNGKVVASLRDVSGDKPMAFSSMNGTIDLTLPANAKANLKMRSDFGDIYSDFDVKQTAAPAIESSKNPGGGTRVEINKSIDGTINNGGPNIELRTFQGNIYIRKSK